MNVIIDKFTPCLEKTSTGELVDTLYSPATSDDLYKTKEWQFNWRANDLKGCEIFKLIAANDDRIQGLIAIQDIPRDKAVFIKIAESAPHNMSRTKEYSGVGGHLYAIAAHRSMELGYGGFMYMDAKNLRLVSHYAKTLGAVFIGSPHPYRMAIDEIAAKKLIDFYNFRRDSNV